MSVTSNELEHVDRSELNLWFCNGCGVVHLTAGGMRLSFTRAEYSVFTEMVVDTYFLGWPRIGANFHFKNLGDVDSEKTFISIEAEI
ncbi:MAG: hypothetical protein ACT4O9_06905 [Blastocatellia bacterium]